MKTYLLDILNRYNRFSENLDVKTVLCNKSWLIFNDTGDKELYIFQENGSLIASVNGNVFNGNWQYISANKSIIISFKEKSYMLHPSFFDKTIFALQQDGTNRYAFMIDEKQSQFFQPKSLTELNSYFADTERKRIEEEQHRKKLWAEQQKEIEQRRIEKEHRERIKKQEEEVQQYKNRKRLDYWEQNQNSILQEDSFYQELCSSKKKWEQREVIFIIGTLIGFFLINIGIFSWGIILMPVCGSLFIMTFLLYYPYTEIREYKEKIKQNVLNGDFDNYIFERNHQGINLTEDTFENIDDFEARIKKTKQEAEKIKKERDKNKKEEEWKDYLRQREKKDFERIEKHRIEREQKEKELKRLKEEENLKKGKEVKKIEELSKKDERRKWLKEEAYNIQCKLNSNNDARELAKQISLEVKFHNAQSNWRFKVNWTCPNKAYKEISLVINNGSDVLLYEHLAFIGCQTIELEEIKSLVRITLRIVWLDIPVYKIILIDKEYESI